MEEFSPLNLILYRSWRRFIRLLAHAARSASFRGAYAVVAALVLLTSTVLWSWLGARVQLHNADQLSDPYLFSDWATFHGAVFPSAHSMLLKWPLFWLVALVGVTSTSLLWATMAVSVLTIVVLMVIVRRIVRRPILLGTIFLALAFVLFLVPAQPYAGGLLPTNMAMLTTRNIEYAIYLVALLCLIRGRRLRTWWAVVGILLLGLLIASDKLFLVFSAGGAALALVVYAICGNWRMVRFSVRWLIGSGLAAVLALLIVIVINGTGLTHISGATSPYAAGVDSKQLALGSLYAVTALLTNFGANPVFGNRVVAQLPHDLLQGARLSTALYGVSLLLFVGVIVPCTQFLRRSLRHVSNDTVHTPMATQLSVGLICSTAVAVVIFVGTAHYYAVDARYLTLALFAGVITTATALRGAAVKRPKWLVLAGLLLTGLSGAAYLHAAHIADTQAAAYQELTARNNLTVQALKQHKADVLVGDYWRVLPIKQQTAGALRVEPLGDCITPTGALTSSVWQPDLRHHRFAYLLTIHGSLTNYPSCSLEQVTTAYGHPNSIQVIAGSLANPQEAVLFYDDGAHPQATPVVPQPSVASLLPQALDQITKTTCIQPTILNVVAHEDDDLLFLNPDILHELDANDCIRTVYVTAGDGGHGQLYWLSRQLGVEAAYSTMLGIANIWNQQTLALAPGQYATIATPRDSSRVSLIFMNLPDGDIHGDGFKESNYESLARLQRGDITTLQSVDGQSRYTSDQLVQALALLMGLYQPSEVHTQADMSGGQYPDHSDHIATSQYAQAAAARYAVQLPSAPR